MTRVIRDAKEYAGLCRYCEQIILQGELVRDGAGQPFHDECLMALSLDFGAG